MFDRGLPGRELNGSTPIIYLYNATDKYYGYPNPWLSGKGRHGLQYALMFHDGDWRGASIARMAWEFNCPPLVFAGRRAARPWSFLHTSDNIIVEAVRRIGSDIEVRFAECLGWAGTAEITLLLPHQSARVTDMNGEHASPLTGGPAYKLPVNPQQIVTLRFRTARPVPEAEIITRWDPMVPPAKRAMLHQYSSEKGHPPRGD